MISQEVFRDSVATVDSQMETSFAPAAELTRPIFETGFYLILNKSYDPQRWEILSHCSIHIV